MLIAERMLRGRDGDTEHGVAVRVFLPVESEEAWRCDWEIHWPDGLRRATARGHDSIQAMVLALQAIGAELHASDMHATRRLSWIDGWSGYGVPVSRSIRDQLRGDDAETL